MDPHSALDTLDSYSVHVSLAVSLCSLNSHSLRVSSSWNTTTMDNSIQQHITDHDDNQSTNIQFNKEEQIQLYELYNIAEYNPDNSHSQPHSSLSHNTQIQQQQYSLSHGTLSQHNTIAQHNTLSQHNTIAQQQNTYTHLPRRLFNNIAQRLVRTLDGLLISPSIPPALVGLLPLINTPWHIVTSPCGRYLAVLGDDAVEIRAGEYWNVLARVDVDFDGFPSWRWVSHGMAWHGMARHGTAWRCTTLYAMGGVDK